MKKLFIVHYEYYEKGSNKIEKDMWTFACENAGDVRKSMDYNKAQFDKHGYVMTGYSIKEISTTHNGYPVYIGDKYLHFNKREREYEYQCKR